MNKIHSINVGGYPFSIDEDAYRELENYLSKIEDYFRRSEGFKEITEDIEIRLAELLVEHKGDRPIVSIADVNHAISIMGTTEDFELESTYAGEHTKRKREYQTGRKLFRDPDDKIIGGVCSGLAAYFGIQDVIWVRIVFAIAGISGVFVLPYILLWALVPIAETPADYLAMRGESINVRNIAKIVEEHVEEISEQLSDLGNDWKKNRRKKKSKRNR